MTTKVLLVDPSIGFAVGIKRALEQQGGFRVTTFANGQAALELVRAEPQDVAILDFEPSDTDIATLIAALRTAQPQLFILLSPRTDAQAARVPLLNVQGSITKPYLARQLIPVIRETLAALSRFTPPPVAPAAPPEPITPPSGTAIVSADFEAVLAELPLEMLEPAVAEDDTFHRHIAALQADRPVTTAGLRKTLETFAVTPIADDSTLGEAIGSAPPVISVAPEAPLPEPVLIAPESPAAEPSFVAALTATPIVELPAAAALDNTDAEDDSAAEIAARLTHLAIGSLAHATILTRAGTLVAAAGELSDWAVAGVVETIVQIWQTTDEETPDNPDSDGVVPPRIRYIQVPGVGDFALYSIATLGDLYLSVLFPADTSLRLIRQQARHLIDALEHYAAEPDAPDESAEASESEAARTLISRPTELRPPEGLRDAAAEIAEPPTALTVVSDVPYSPYTLLWLPRMATLSADVAAQLPGWIERAAASRAWKVAECAVSAACVSVRIDLPADQTPGAAVEMLQRATADSAQSPELWSDAYYVIASERAVTPLEIEQFVGYGHSANNG